jgi:tetratricopeptide (TPR) repeat protein
MNLVCFGRFSFVVLAGSLFGVTDEMTWRLLIAEAGRAQEQQQFDSAEAAYTSAMHEAEKITESTAYQGITANDLALLYQRHGDFVLAEKYYLIALSFFRRSNERYMDRRTVGNLASLYLELGQASKTENLLRPFIPDDAHPSAIDADDAILLSDLASIRVRQKRLGDAERLFHAVIDFLGDRHDAESEEIRGNVMSDLAEVYYLSGRLSEAVAHGRLAVNIFETLPYEYAGNVVRGLVNLAMFTMRSGESYESAELFRRAIATSEAALGPEHPLLGEVLARYAVFLRGTKRNAEARKIERRAQKIQTKSRRENFLGHTVEVGALASEIKPQAPVTNQAKK